MASAEHAGGSARVCVVTGAAAGLGREIARRFAADGDDVVLVDRAGPRAGAVAEEIRAAGGRAEARNADVSDEDAVEGLARWLAAERGHVDVLVNNAGLALREGSVVDMSRKAWDLTIAVNLTGVFLVSRHVVPLMPHGGVVVNVSTNGAVHAVPGTDAYVAAKAGVIGLSKAMALSLADRGIRVNVVCPGVFLTEEVASRLEDPRVHAMLERGRPVGRGFGQPEEFASVVAFLCSDQAAFVNAANLVVDGGAVA